MIWVLSGTKDGAKIISPLKKEGVRVFASAVTEYGAEMSKKAGADSVIARAADCDEMVEIINKKKISAVVDATHPFAVEASKNAMRACRKAGISYIRYERKAAKIPDSALVHHVRDFREAGKKAAQLGNVIFFAAGSRNLDKFLKAAKRKKIIARVLPDVKAIQKCLSLGLKPSEIIAAEGPLSEAFNKAMLREYKADVVVTKESGTVGGVESKVNAALALDIPVIIVKRPEIEYSAVASDYKDVVNWLRREGIKNEA